MPESREQVREHPGRPLRRLKDAAADGQVVMVRCNLCKRRANYLAADLVTVLDPERDAHLPPFVCSKCGTTDYIDVRLRLPYDDDHGRLRIRRPVGVKKVIVWQDGYL